LAFPDSNPGLSSGSKAADTVAGANRHRIRMERVILMIALKKSKNPSYGIALSDKKPCFDKPVPIFETIIPKSAT
jgi:hypothetical protein